MGIWIFIVNIPTLLLTFTITILYVKCHWVFLNTLGYGLMGSSRRKLEIVFIPLPLLDHFSGAKVVITTHKLVIWDYWATCCHHGRPMDLEPHQQLVVVRVLCLSWLFQLGTFFLLHYATAKCTTCSTWCLTWFEGSLMWCSRTWSVIQCYCVNVKQKTCK